MNTFYLVDFENVHNNGIANIEKLDLSDRVFIFCTKIEDEKKYKNKKSRAQIETHLVKPGKQSLDMHLISYLGYLLREHGNKIEYIIISNDKDYDNVIDDWKNKGYSNISKASQVEHNKFIPQTLEDFVVKNLKSKGYDSGKSKSIAEISTRYNGLACVEKKYGKSSHEYRDVKEIHDIYNKGL